MWTGGSQSREDLVTTGANWAYDHNKNIATFERYDRTFLEHAGLHKPQADVMDEHGWWSSESKADGIVTGYLAMGGDVRWAPS